jgi:cytochrome P450
MGLDEIDLSDTRLYTTGDAHLAWQTLRAESPISRHETPRGTGYWSVTRRADVWRVLRDHETFTSERGTALCMLGAPDPAAGKMMHATDPPRHRQVRARFEEPLSESAMPAYAGGVRALVRETVAPVRDAEVWDAAAAFTRLPMAVAAMLMDLPQADIEPLLRLSYAALAPLDPHYRFGSERVTVRRAHHDIMLYFERRIRERGKNPSADLISHLVTMEVDGRRLSREELLLNCLSLMVGSVVTTAQAVSATLIAMAEQGGGEGRWGSAPPGPAAVEEALRWSSPTTHFLRHARRDVELHGEKIHAGDAVAAWIASANRDEDAFDRPYTLDFDRAPNRHLAFGSGPHRCVGSQLARLMLRLSFAELYRTIECFEPAGPPCHLVSNEIAGVVSLPLRVRLRPA